MAHDHHLPSDPGFLSLAYGPIPAPLPKVVMRPKPDRCEGDGCPCKDDLQYDRVSDRWLCPRCWRRMSPVRGKP